MTGNKFTRRLPSSADVVVVGGGLMGTAIAWHLALTGLRVLVIDRGGLAGAASGANMGMINVSMKQPAAYARLSLESSRIYPQMLARLPEPVPFWRTGTVYLAQGRPAESGRQADDLDEGRDGESSTYLEERFREVQKIPGVTLEKVERLQVEELLGFAPARYQKASYCSIDCWVNPLRLNMALIRALEGLGSHHACGVEFQNLETDNGRVTAMRTNEGRVVTPRVIMACGIALPRLLKPWGVDFPVRPDRGHVLLTEPLPYKILPHAVHISRNGNFIVLVQTDKRHLLIGVTHEGGVDSREINLPLAMDLARRAATVYPFLKDLKLLRIWAGVRPWPGDGLPIIEDFEQPQGLMAVVTHSGVTLCAKLSQMAADLIFGGPMAAEAAMYSIKRFHKE